MSDRHPKWVPVSPGTVIPAGQPYRVEWRELQMLQATEYSGERPAWTVEDDTDCEYFVDSSWVPPLVLPTEPTWGIVVSPSGGSTMTAKWRLVQGEVSDVLDGRPFWTVIAANVADFIPLTDEQVARIEAAR